MFEIAKEQNRLEGWAADLGQVSAAARDSQLATLMDSPQFPFERKAAVLKGQFKDLNPLVVNLLHVLTNRGKFNLLPEIYAEYQNLFNEYRGIEAAEVTTAVRLEDKQKQALVQDLQELTGKKVILTTCVDPAILGGIVIRVGGKLIDGSTRSRLAALKSELAGAR